MPNFQVIGKKNYRCILRRVGRVCSYLVFRDSAGYARGVKTAEEMDYVAIAINNVWSGNIKSGGRCFSYERVGISDDSVEFLTGLLSANCPVYARFSDGWYQIVLTVSSAIAGFNLQTQRSNNDDSTGCNGFEQFDACQD